MVLIEPIVVLCLLCKQFLAELNNNGKSFYTGNVVDRKSDGIKNQKLFRQTLNQAIRD